MKKEQWKRLIMNRKRASKIQIRKLFCSLGIAILVYVLICCLVPPMFRKQVVGNETGSYAAWQMEEKASCRERIRSIDTNEEALLWRLRVIREAERELVLTTFDFRDDHSGKDIIAALAEAADRGVHIRVLVDGINGGLYLKGSDSFQAFSSMPNVEVKLYNPIHFTTLWKVNYRMHDKYLIADDTAYILGGRNTNDLFLGNYVDEYNVDRDALVYCKDSEGSSLTELKHYFESIWNLECCEKFDGRVQAEKMTATLAELDRHMEHLKETYPELTQEIRWDVETVETNQITLLTNPMNAGNKAPELWNILKQYMAGGKDILINTPYVICSEEMYAGISEVCAGEGTRVQIMMNAVEKGSNPFGCTDYLNSKSDVLATNVEVMEWLGEQALHTKAILIDERISIIGSYNLDARSTYLDTEMMLVVDCPQLNETLRSQYAEMEKQCKHVYPDATEQTGAEYVPVQLSVAKKVLYGLLRIMVRPIRYLL